MLRTRRWLVLATLVAAAVPGCREGGGGDPPDSGVAEDYGSFALSFVEVLCALRERCCVPSEPAAACELDLGARLAAFGMLYVEPGDVVYDAACGAALLDWVRGASCEDVAAVNPSATPGAILSSCQDGLIRGTRRLGESCGSGPVSTDDVCEPGLFCDSLAGDPVCAEPARAGEACGGLDTPDCGQALYCGTDQTCVPRLGEGEPCESGPEPCGDGLRCDEGAGECVAEGLCDE